MASEWEELEKLSKEEIIIELVKERTAHRELDRALRGLVEVDYPADRKLPVFADDEDGSFRETTDDWAYRIAKYAYEHAADRDDFSHYDLDAYGLDEDQAEEAYRRLRMDGTIASDRNDLQGWFRGPCLRAGMRSRWSPPRPKRTRSKGPGDPADNWIATTSRRWSEETPYRICASTTGPTEVVQQLFRPILSVVTDEFAGVDLQNTRGSSRHRVFFHGLTVGNGSNHRFTPHVSTPSWIGTGGGMKISKKVVIECKKFSHHDAGFSHSDMMKVDIASGCHWVDCMMHPDAMSYGPNNSHYGGSERYRIKDKNRPSGFRSKDEEGEMRWRANGRSLSPGPRRI